MKIHVRDPGHVAMRRGIRAAIGVPVACLLALWVLPDSPAALVSAFGSLCLIALCDYGGPPLRKVGLLLGAGAAGAVLITIGVGVSGSLVAAVLVTFVVGALLAFSGVLRGSVAASGAAMTIMFVVAVTLGLPADQVLKALVGWALALLVAIPVTVLVLPRRDLSGVRQACAGAIAAFADGIAARGRGEEPDREALEAAQAALRRSYLGNPFRAAGLSRRDRALVALAGQMQGLLSIMIHGRAYPTPMLDEPVTVRLNAQSAQALRDAAAALGRGGAGAPADLSVRPIVEDWGGQWAMAVSLLAGAGPAEVEQRVRDVSALFPDRTMAVASVRVVMLVRRVLGLPDEDYPAGADQPAIPPPAVASGRDDVRANLTLRSPWVRQALRVGLGLALAVLVVWLMGLAHGLWVVLGVTAVLRFDGLTTMRTAGYALLGTFGGALVGYLILAGDPAYVGVLWVVLVLATFLAVWVPVAIGFAWGQAAFSLFVIVAFTLMTWPPDLDTASERLLDVAVGAVVSIIVALLLWPGGVLSGMIANVADAVRTSTRLLREGVTSLVVGGDVESGLAAQSVRAMERSEEVVELSISSTNGGATAYAHQWQEVIDHLRNPSVAGRLLAGWSHVRAPIASVVPSLAEPLMGELNAVSGEWEGIAAEIDGAAHRPQEHDPETLASIAAVASSVDLSRPEVADTFVAAVWGHGWLRMCLAAGRACEVPSPAP